MAQQSGQQRGIGVSPAQVIAGALASVSAAVIASYFGIGGTLIGAAATSVVATVGGALYKSSIERTQARVVRIRRNPRTGDLTGEVVAPPARRAGLIRWGAVLGGLAVVLALTFGAVTAVEALARKPLAALVQRESPPPGETTLGAVVQAVTDPEPTAPPEPATAPAPVAAPETPTAAVGPTATATVAGRTPTAAQPTAVTTAQPSGAPTRTAPAAAPTTVAPTRAPSSAPASVPAVASPEEP